jgi:hypothetical protein
MRSILIALTLLVALAAPARATTWGEVTKECPLCDRQSTLQAPMSSGSYIYRWPSRFQVVFWPATDERSVYSCGACRFTCLMWDWDRAIPQEQAQAVRAALADIAFSVTDRGYRGIPVLERLRAAAKVYDVVGQDGEQSCQLQRIIAYHAAKQGEREEAVAARRRALAIADELLATPERAGRAKELQVIAACMLRLLGDPDGARARLELAAPLHITAGAEDPEGVTAYFDELIVALRGLLDSGDLADDAPERR